jgi:hypothetical protein
MSGYHDAAGSLRSSAEYEAEYAEAWANLVAVIQSSGAERLRAVRTGFGGAVVPVAATYPANVAEDAVVARTAVPEHILATEDGLWAEPLVWHDGPESSEDSVYYERWESGVRVGHGYVDRVSRRLVQSG